MIDVNDEGRMIIDIHDAGRQMMNTHDPRSRIIKINVEGREKSGIYIQEVT